MAPITFFGVIASFGFILYALLVFVQLHGFKVHRKKLVYQFVVFVAFLLPFVIYPSVVNDASIALNTMKYLQTIVIWSTLILFTFSKYRLDVSYIKSFMKAFIFISLISGIFIHFIFNGYDEGMFRFSAIFFDANYYGLLCLVLYFVVDLSCQSSNWLKRALIIMTFLSVSSTAILGLLIYIVTSKVKVVPILKYYSIFSIMIILNIIYYFIMNFLDSYKPNADSSMFITYKLVSLSHRLAVQFDALDMIFANTGWLFGYGSGRNIELVGLALHNGYLQYIFSHGVVYFSLNLMIITWVYKLCFDKALLTAHKRKLQGIFLSMIMAGFLLDPFISLYFHLIVIFYISYINRLNPIEPKMRLF
ncbi:hypothetical protein A9Q81_16615 [Gammaproteobacteria bacterium 42_54_T18]|nr:hypothetical protein A9Q81_16615 [Gammaproteobacteria bacterium 42_54_T18]